ncbi:hypothetical protein M758_3G196700 [Ceratodon purpureus]|nr:hypothetical protein M758_3G196700 [Ceratodon purpureus]
MLQFGAILVTPTHSGDHLCSNVPLGAYFLEDAAPSQTRRPSGFTSSVRSFSSTVSCTVMSQWMSQCDGTVAWRGIFNGTKRNGSLEEFQKTPPKG